MEDDERPEYRHPPWWLLAIIVAVDTGLIVVIGMVTDQPLGLLLVEWLGALALGTWVWRGASRPS